jgi:hypothetical protein
VRAVNYMMVSYDDQFRSPHTMQRCFYWHPGMQSPVACDRQNREH